MFVWFGTIGFSQSIPFSKQAFPKNSSQLKKAQGSIKEGDYYFYLKNYYFALNHYLDADEFNENNAELNYKIGVCYLNTVLRFKCLDFFVRSFQLKRDVSPDIHFMLGRGFHLNQDFDAAINEYKAYLSILPAEEKVLEKPVIDEFVIECERGKELTLKEPRALVDNMGLVINSIYHDHSPLITADESKLVFTSTRNNGRKIGDDGQYDEDIYISHKKGDGWTQPEPMMQPINTQFNDATVGLSPDGQKLLIYNGNRGNGDIQICQLEGDEWNYPKSLPKTINSEYKESAACFSPDGNQLYFVSDRQGGVGGSDIYVSTKNAKEKWTHAVNLGKVVNSASNEETVFMHPDGRTLYFSSEGHNTTGGFDIFVTHKLPDGSWTVPENLGYPVNSPDDDLCFVISANGRRGYCSSVRPDSYGGFDIYQMTFLGQQKPIILTNEDNLISARNSPVSNMVTEQSEELKTIRLTIIKGFVKESGTNKPIAAKIDIVDNELNKVIFTLQTNSLTGKYLVSLPSGKNYGLLFYANNYLFHSENFNLPDEVEYQEIKKDIFIEPIKKDAKVILKNVFFEKGKTKLKPTSFAEIDRLLLLLNENSDLRIEISVYADKQGDIDANKVLSENRAEALTNFLISKGISVDRLEYTEYAIRQPITDKLNNSINFLKPQVEFRVLGNY